MNALLFAGNSLNNKSWVYGLRDELQPLYTSVTVHDYAHWNSGKPFIDFKMELDRLHNETLPDTPYIVVAKSVGTLLTAQAINAGIINPVQCVFLGLPLKLIEKEAYPLATWLRNYHHPVTIIQNTNDPVGSYEAVKDFIVQTNLGQCLCIELPGSSHDYTATTKLKQILTVLKKSA